MSQSSLFADRVAVIATMHRKETVMAPILEQELGVKVRVPQNFDTDVLGTFTREIERPADQVSTARRKAEQALDLTGETLAIASEGSFGPHPQVPFVACNREIVLLLDRLNELEIVGQVMSTETNYSHQAISSIQEAYEFARRAGFPEHGLVVMATPDAKAETQIIKGIKTQTTLTAAVTVALKRSPTGKAHIETDMRALHNPTRMKNIAKATQNLASRLNHLCPTCSYPGFEVVSEHRGLPCSLCGLPTQLVRSAVYQCQRCAFTQEVPFPQGVKQADPAYCLYCNP